MAMALNEIEYLDMIGHTSTAPRSPAGRGTCHARLSLEILLLLHQALVILLY